MDLLMSTAYLAPIEYYAKLINVENDIYIDKHEHYIKQSYRNRCNVVAANGVQSLSIPIESANGLKMATKDIRISDHGGWQHLHWNAIVSAYNSTPFFEYYSDDFYPFYHKKYSFLFDFNEELFSLICDFIDIEFKSIKYTDKYLSSDGYLDFRRTISPKIDWKVSDEDFFSVPYYQVFQDKLGFIDNVSIIDLLFNMGNESLIILNKSNKKTV